MSHLKLIYFIDFIFLKFFSENETEFVIENDEILNNLSSSSSSSDAEIVREGDDDDDDIEDDTHLDDSNKPQQVERSSIESDASFRKNTATDDSNIAWSDFEMDSQDFIIKKSKPKRKFKGVKRMVIQLERLDVSKLGSKCLEIAKSHYCHYFKTRAHLDDCSHRENHIFQGSCLKCDFKKDHEDSLKHMAYLSPTAGNPKKFDKPFFDSPTVINDENSTETSTTLKNEYEDDDTLIEATSTATTTDDETLTDSTCCSMEISSDDEAARSERQEERRKKFFDKIIKIQSCTVEHISFADKKVNDSGIWFCPVENIQINLNDSVKMAADDSIICYSTDNNKKWV